MVILLAELRLKIISDLSKVKSDIKTLMKEKFKIGTEGGGGGGILGKLGLGKLALIAAGIFAISAGVKKMVRGLAASSPYLKGVFSLFKRASMYFFKPFGDFLATLLKPLAIVLLRAAAGWMEFWRGGEKEGGLGKIIGEPFEFGKWIGEHIGDFFIGVFNFSEWMGTAIANFFIGAFKFGEWMGLAIAGLFWGAFNFGEFLALKIKEYILGKFDLGLWLENNIHPFFHGLLDIGEWLGEHFMEFFLNTMDIGEWLGEHFMEFIENTFDIGSWLWENFTNFIVGAFNIGDWIMNLLFGGKKGKGVSGSWQTGTDFVPKTGLYQLHRGEAVIPAGKNTSRTTVFKPTFNFSGNVNSDIDIDSMMRRANRQSIMNLRRLASI